MNWICMLLGHRWRRKSIYGNGQPRCLACHRCGVEAVLIRMVTDD